MNEFNRIYIDWASMKPDPEPPIVVRDPLDYDDPPRPKPRPPKKPESSEFNYHRWLAQRRWE
ncbi:hypothetical protein DESC_240075 [Desulfosarcina cetonica]|nr:hypothetical protein DESC_240075 [Desulfosarcina cetonica]